MKKGLHLNQETKLGAFCVEFASSLVSATPENHAVLTLPVCSLPYCICIYTFNLLAALNIEKL